MPNSDTARKRQSYLKGFLFLLLCIVFSAAYANNADNQDHEQRLEQAFKMRSSDPQKANQLLASISRDALDEINKDLYDQTAAYLIIMNGDLAGAIEAFKKLTAETRSKNLRFTAHGALTALYSGTQNWSDAFDSLEYLTENIADIDDVEAEEQAHNAILNLYSAIDENETVVSYGTPLIGTSFSPRFNCVATMHIVTAQVEIEDPSLSEYTFKAAAERCSTANEPIVIFALYSKYASYLYQQGQRETALAVLLEHLSGAEKTNYVPLMDDYYALLSQSYFDSGDFKKSQYYALKVVGNTELDAFVSRADITAYEALYKVAENQQNYEIALSYYKLFAQAQSLNISNENAKMLSVQKARQDSAEKSNQIALLDTENSLLRAQAQLGKEADQNRKLLIAFMIFALLAICLWVYKKRSHYLTLQEISQKDALTGVANRHYFTKSANELVKNCSNNQVDVSLVLFDLDDFKKINDTFGHKAGDIALQAAVNSTRKGCREIDLIGRLGGEEFGIVLEACDIAKALEIAEKCRREIEKTNESDSQSYQLTASFGVASASASGYNFDNLFEAADKALYQSKKAGKNQVSQ